MMARETIHPGRVGVVEGAGFVVTGSRERRDWDSHIPFEGMLPRTQRALSRLHLLAELKSKLKKSLIHSLCWQGDVGDPDYNIRAFAGLDSNQATN